MPFFMITCRSAMVERVGVAHVQLVLARAPLALGVLDRNAGALQAVAHGLQQVLFLAGLQDVVVLDEACWRSGGPRKCFAPRRFVGFLEDVELEFRGAKAACRAVEPRDLLQDRAGACGRSWP